MNKVISHVASVATPCQFRESRSSKSQRAAYSATTRKANGLAAATPSVVRRCLSERIGEATNNQQVEFQPGTKACSSGEPSQCGARVGDRSQHQRDAWTCYVKVEPASPNRPRLFNRSRISTT